jgi:hypothetical protein
MPVTTSHTPGEHRKQFVITAIETSQIILKLDVTGGKRNVQLEALILLLRPKINVLIHF